MPGSEQEARTDDDRILALFGEIMAKLERMDDRPTGHASRFDKVDGQLDAIRTDVSVNMLAILAESRRARHDREEPVDTNELLRQALEQITRRRIDVDDLKRRAA